MDERIRPGKLHEEPEEKMEPDNYRGKEGDVEFGMRSMNDWPYFPSYDPAPKTRAADEGSSAELRRERIANAESGGYDTPGFGKVRSLPSQS